MPIRESRRADSNRLPLLITSDPSGVAGGCTALRNPHIWGTFFAVPCPALHRIALPVVREWYQKATGDASRPLYNERPFFTFTVPGVRGDVSSLDRYYHWKASMGRHAVEGMDEALG